MAPEQEQGYSSPTNPKRGATATQGYSRSREEHEQGYSSPRDPKTYFYRDADNLRSKVQSDALKDGLRPTLSVASGSAYRGRWKGSLRHGFGISTWPDGARFSGFWQENLAHGHGAFVHPNGGVFIGQWVDNSAEGHGTMYDPLGTPVYRGQWNQDLQHGCGIEQWQGCVYSGQFVHGMKQGRGRHEWPDKSVYSGDWYAASVSGHGEFRSRDGQCTKGIWKDGLMNGCGSSFWPDGRTFEGQYVRGLKHGFGIFTWPDGGSFEGWWHEGKEHGNGILYRSDKNGKHIAKKCEWWLGVPAVDSPKVGFSLPAVDSPKVGFSVGHSQVTFEEETNMPSLLHNGWNPAHLANLPVEHVLHEEPRHATPMRKTERVHPQTGFDSFDMDMSALSVRSSDLALAIDRALEDDSFCASSRSA